MDGSCEPAGIPPGSCGVGFASDGARGCNALLPAEPCPSGLMALPGETTCREVAPCGQAPWGDIPSDGLTQFVDASYAGGASDGTEANPWTTIADALLAADAGAIIAVAEGSYSEDVHIRFKPVKLWGRCPARVEIVATGAQVSAILVENGANGTELRGVAVRGSADGVLGAGSQDVLVDKLWIHDVSGRGVDLEDVIGPTSATVRDTLVERTGMLAVYVGGASALIERSELRDAAQPGVLAEASPASSSPAELTLHAAVVTGAHQQGVAGFGSMLALEDSLVRDTIPAAIDPTVGMGVLMQGNTGARTSLTVTGSVLERNAGLGALVIKADAVIERTVVRDTLTLDPIFHSGDGLRVQLDPATGERASLTMRRSVLERNGTTAAGIAGSDALIDASIFRDTLPRPSDGRFGMGLSIQRPLERPDAPAAATVRTSLVDRCLDVGIVVNASEAVIEATAVIGTQGRERDGAFGDGIIIADRATAPVIVDRVHVGGSARAGLANFGGSVRLSASTLDCNTLDLAGEPLVSPFEFLDLGGNFCGCGEAFEPCRVVSSNLAPPQSLQP